MASSGTFLRIELIKSDAFRALTKTAIRVLMAFLLKQRFQKSGKKYRVINNGELEFTYKEAEYKWGIKQSAFREALDRLIGVGFLDITKPGRGMEKSKSLYALSDRWKQYGKADFKIVVREKDSRRIGYQNPKKRKKKLP